MALTAHEYPLKKVFSADFDFEVPVYQRPYAWGVEQAVQLLDDLQDAAGRSTDEPYFLGSLVLVRPDEAKGVAEVIDGQQRLTTLSILFAVLRELAEDEATKIVLRDMVLEPGVALDGILAQPRLRLRKQDADFFAKYVQSPGKISELVVLNDQGLTGQSQKAIRDNTTALHERLMLWSDDERNKLAALARNRTYLVLVSTPDLASAHRIFSVINARGLDLSPTDIFKSEVIGELPDSYAEKWESQEEALGRESFEELFRDIRTIFSKERAKVELLKEFREQVLGRYRDSGRLAEFVDGVLIPYASAFGWTLTRDLGPGDEWKPVNEWLSRLDLIDNRDWRAPAIWALEHHTNDPQYLNVFLRKLERLAASSLLRGEYSTPRIERYLQLLRRLDAGDGLDAVPFDLTDDEKREACAGLDGEIYRMQPRRLRYVMLRLEGILSHASGATFDHKIISVEHVLPQHPKESSHWLQDFDNEQRMHWLHRLGNLLLLSRIKNAAAGRKPFDEKKQKYFQVKGGGTNFVLTTQVINEAEWTPLVVEERHRKLIKTLIDEWELN
jgi:hypothetical protein